MWTVFPRNGIMAFVCIYSFYPCPLCHWSVRFSYSVVSNSLRPNGLQHARLSYPSPTPRACSNSCPSSQWCHPNISSSVIPFSCPQSFPASGSFLIIRWPKYWSFSFSISPSNEYSGLIFFRIVWLDLLAVQGTLKSLLQHHSSKHQFFSAQVSLWSSSHIIHDYWKTIALTRQTFVSNESAF